MGKNIFISLDGEAMTPAKRLKEIKELFLQMKLGKTFEERILAEELLMNHFLDLSNRVKSLTEALKKVSSKSHCTACSCACHEVADKALEES